MEARGISVRFQGSLQVIRFASPDWDHMDQRQFRKNSFAKSHIKSGVNHVCVPTKPHFRTDRIKSPAVGLPVQPVQVGQRAFAPPAKSGTPWSAGMMILHIGPDPRVYPTAT